MTSSRRSKRRLRLAALLLGLALTGSAHAFDPIGVWKMAFEPGLPGVYELSEGYLVFLPDQRYFQIWRDCCGPGGPSSELGWYLVEGDKVYLSSTPVDKTRYERRLDFVGEVSVVLFDDPHGEPIKAPVLSSGRDLNYSFARVYPTVDADRSGPRASDR